MLEEMVTAILKHNDYKTLSEIGKITVLDNYVIVEKDDEMVKIDKVTGEILGHIIF